MDIYTPIILEYKISTLDSIHSLAQFNFLSFYNHVLFILYNLGGETWKKESQIKLIFFLVQVKIYWCLAFSLFLSLFQCTNDFFTYIKCIFIGLIKYFTCYYSTLISLDSNISYLTNTERKCRQSVSLFNFSFFLFPILCIQSYKSSSWEDQ